MLQVLARIEENKRTEHPRSDIVEYDNPKLWEGYETRILVDKKKKEVGGHGEMDKGEAYDEVK